MADKGVPSNGAERQIKHISDDRRPKFYKSKLKLVIKERDLSLSTKR